MARLRSFLSGVVRGGLEQQEQEQAFQNALRLALAQAQIQAQTQQLDPSQILSQLQLRQIVNQMGGQQPMGQPMPTGQPIMGQPRQPAMGRPEAVQPQLQPVQRGISQPVTLRQGLSRLQSIPRTERVVTGINKYTGLPEYKEEMTPEYKAEIEVEKEALAQERKKTAELERLSKTAFTKMDTMFGAWLDTVARTYELTGVKPGPQQAPLTAILGKTKLNEFQEAFQGAQPEYAAAIGRMAVPGARSVRLIDLFKKGAPSVWSSIPSGIINSARSARMQFAGYLASDEGSKALGVPYDPVNPLAWKDAANRALTEFEERYREGLYEMVFMRNPDLLDPQTRNRITREFQAEMNRRRLNGRL